MLTSPDANRCAMAGFTLLEVLIAITVMSVGLLGVSTMLTHITQQQSMNANRAIATTLAREQLEQIKQVDYANVTVANYPQEAYGSMAGYEQFQRTVAIADDTPLANTKTVTITVTWADPFRGLRNTTINTVIAP
ncbi:MAG: hypothetical protein ETSY1_10590 [Candidatus Entotheonella factor]|uniref:Type IV pilus modification protein PilV n=1 Tax=Entotheonella factor TaxID=1429438 RepID=W4LS88_ENTF1|nr:prepilin-type N-terminal cleavage/methylation domain-containing protein [Candidatus Entotheonella palauensis]ETX00616.1 MAG: hypothetical protein ETSY1_10590 [Candidatus Entotheonella factor]